MITDYAGVLIFLSIGIGFVAVVFSLSYVLRPSKPTPEKLMPYECGNVPTGDARGYFSIKYYLIAILGVLFDVETAFMFPWAVVFRDLGIFGLIEMAIFLFVILVGFCYAWKKGALEWV
ncbi:MAG: NADH-quinone oxidoreductase subunit A [bacterium]